MSFCKYCFRDFIWDKKKLIAVFLYTEVALLLKKKERKKVALQNILPVCYHHPPLNYAIETYISNFVAQLISRIIFTRYTESQTIQMSV